MGGSGGERGGDCPAAGSWRQHRRCSEGESESEGLKHENLE